MRLISAFLARIRSAFPAWIRSLRSEPQAGLAPSRLRRLAASQAAVEERVEEKAKTGERWSAAPGGFGNRAAAAEGESAGHRLDLSTLSVRIEDRVVEVVRPNGEALPEQELVAALRAEPDAVLALPNGRAAPARRVAAVLEAQAMGWLCERSLGAPDWLLAMLDPSSDPDPAEPEALSAERCSCELTVFGAEILISTIDGASFLLTTAPGEELGDRSVRLELEGGVTSLPELIAWLRASSSDEASAGARAADNPCVAEVEVAIEAEALVLRIASGGSLRIVSAAVPDEGPDRVGIFRPEGEPVALVDLIEALATLASDSSVQAQLAPAAAQEQAAADAGAQPVAAIRDMLPPEPSNPALPVEMTQGPEPAPVGKDEPAREPRDPALVMEAEPVPMGEDLTPPEPGDPTPPIEAMPEGELLAEDEDLTPPELGDPTPPVEAMPEAERVSPHEDLQPLQPVDQAPAVETVPEAEPVPMGEDLPPLPGDPTRPVEAMPEGELLAEGEDLPPPEPGDPIPPVEAMPEAEPVPMAENLAPPEPGDRAPTVGAVPEAGLVTPLEDVQPLQPVDQAPAIESVPVPMGEDLTPEPEPVAGRNRAEVTAEPGRGRAGSARHQAPADPIPAESTACADTVDGDPARLPDSRILPVKPFLATAPESAEAPVVLFVRDLPKGARLNAGVNDGGVWIVSPSDADHLQILLPPDHAGGVALTVVAVDIDELNGAMSTTTQELVLSGEPHDTPVATPTGLTAMVLELDPYLAELCDSRAPDAIVVGGLPAGASLTRGRQDPAIDAWILRREDLEDLAVAGLPAPLQTLSLRLTAVLLDPATGAPETLSQVLQLPCAPQPERAAPADSAGSFRPLARRRA